MSFFKKPLPSIKAYNNSLLTWWLAVNSYYNCWPKQKSDYTRRFETLILPMLYEYEKQTLQNKIKIKKLAIDWVNIHNKENLKSNRMLQMHQFIAYIDDDIKNEDKNQSRFNTFSDLSWPKYEKGLFGPGYYKSLYQWWKNLSRLSWYQYRSMATRKLDREMEKLFTLIIIDDVSALENLLSQVDAWILQRFESSERLPAVNLLKAHLEDMLHEARLEDKFAHRYPRNTSWLSANLFASLGCYLSDLINEFNLLSEILII